MATYSFPWMQGFSDAELVVGSVIALRSWLYRPVDERLVGLFTQDWEPGENRARCLSKKTHTPPVEDCGCGFWAWYPHEYTKPYRRWAYRRVVGVVELAGRMICGEKGFRAERAKILALAPIGSLATGWSPPWTTFTTSLGRYEDAGVKLYNDPLLMVYMFRDTFTMPRDIYGESLTHDVA